MNTVVIEHVPISELPAAWRNLLPVPSQSRVTIKIEVESDTNKQISAVDNAPQESLVEFMRRSPLYGFEDVELNRDRSPTRELDF